MQNQFNLDAGELIVSIAWVRFKAEAEAEAGQAAMCKRVSCRLSAILLASFVALSSQKEREVPEWPI